MLDVSSQASRRTFVLQQLNHYFGPKKKYNDESTFVVCPFHADKDPSGRIYHSLTSRSPGFFRCYGCGTTASWNDLAPKLGLEPFKHQKPKDEYALELKFDLEGSESEQKARELRITGELPPNKRWRTISTNLLRDIGAQMCRMYYPDSDYETEPFVYLPCYVRGRVRGYIRARMRKAPDKPSYLNSPGKWSLRYGFFPYDYALTMMRRNKSRAVVLVEGPRDALRLLSMGIPAMAILGTQSWSEAKSRVLELGGVDTVVLFMDGDKAGRKAIKMLKASMGGMFNIVPQRLPVDENRWDPGNCPKWMLQKLKRRIACL